MAGELTWFLDNAMKFKPARLIQYTDDAILEEIRRVAAIVDQSKLTTSDFNEHSRVGLTTLRRRFGSWSKALAAAGVGELYNSVPEARVSRTLARNWSNDEMITEIQRIAALNEQDTLTVEEFRKNAVIGVDSVRRRFGSWSNALSAANLKPVSHGMRYSDEECFENLLNVWTHYGRQPKFQEMNIHPSKVGGKAYVKRWHTWIKAVHAFTEYAESDVPTDPVSEHVPGKPETPSLKKVSAEDRRDPSVGLRYKILARDRFRCVICGRSPATELSCKLHVDHIFPFTKGGKTNYENLRTLCSDCNIGKSDIVENA